MTEREVYCKMDGEIRFPVEETQAIRQAEETTLERYRAALREYAQAFARYGASTVLEIRREPNSSRAWIACRVLGRDGEVVESADRDAYMDFAWMLSIPDRGSVVVCTDVDDEAVEMMQICEAYFRDPY